MKTILHLDSSGRSEASLSRQVSRKQVEALAASTNAEVVYRDLSSGLDFINETMIAGYFTPDADRTEAQREALKLSDELVAELQAAEAVVLGLPIYNFSAPASVKAWADLVARYGVTFEHSENGPVGLLKDRPFHVFVAYGGTEIGSKRDHATPWLKTFLAFIGIQDVRFAPAVAETQKP
jgi:FMN-dependent NADH-azoreductase